MRADIPKFANDGSIFFGLALHRNLQSSFIVNVAGMLRSYCSTRSPSLPLSSGVAGCGGVTSSPTYFEDCSGGELGGDGK